MNNSTPAKSTQTKRIKLKFNKIIQIISDEFSMYIRRMASTGRWKADDLRHEYGQRFFHLSKWRDSNSEANQQRMQLML